MHSDYLEVVGEDEGMGFVSFVTFWHAKLPHIVFMTPRTDVCNLCEQLRAAIKNSSDRAGVVIDATEPPDILGQVGLSDKRAKNLLDHVALFCKPQSKGCLSRNVGKREDCLKTAP